MTKLFILILPLLISLLLTSCSHTIGPKLASDQPAEIDFPVIDAHTHTDFDGKNHLGSNVPYTKAEYLAELEEAGVVGAVSHSFDFKQDHDDLTQYGVVHCAGIREQIHPIALERDLKNGRYRCIKIYLGYVHRWANSPLYQPIYRLAEKYQVPVVFHTGDTDEINAKVKYSDPLTVDEVAVDYPKVTFVIAHMGNPWIQSAAEVAYKNPNVYLDGSAFIIGDLSTFSNEDIEAYMIQPIRWVFGYVNDPTKIMFGTDWPLTRIKPYLELFKKAIPEKHWRAVFHDNAKRVFKMDAVVR